MCDAMDGDMWDPDTPSGKPYGSQPYFNSDPSINRWQWRTEGERIAAYQQDLTEKKNIENNPGIDENPKPLQPKPIHVYVDCSHPTESDSNFPAKKPHKRSLRDFLKYIVSYFAR